MRSDRLRQRHLEADRGDRSCREEGLRRRWRGCWRQQKDRLRRGGGEGRCPQRWGGREVVRQGKQLSEDFAAPLNVCSTHNNHVGQERFWKWSQKLVLPAFVSGGGSRSTSLSSSWMPSSVGTRPWMGMAVAWALAWAFLMILQRLTWLLRSPGWT